MADSVHSCGAHAAGEDEVFERRALVSVRKLWRRAAKPVLVLLFATALLACDDGPAPKSAYTIGLVTNNPNGVKNVQGFRTRLVNLGSLNGREIAFVTPGRPVRGAELDTTIKDFVETGVDLIFTAGTPTGVAAHRITRESRIPVVFGVIADPISAGVISDLNRPGGNMTGVMLGLNQARRLELFLQIVPGIRAVTVLYNPNDSAPASAVAQMEAAASALNVVLQLHKCPTDDAVSAALASISSETDAIFLVPDSLVNRRIKDIVALSLKRKLPLSGPSTAQIDQGAFMTYGFAHTEVGAQAANIAVQILNGLNPGDIPVQAAEAYLGFNLKTADRIGVRIPRHFLESAAVVER